MRLFDRCDECGSIISFLPYKWIKSLLIKFVDVIPEKQSFLMWGDSYSKIVSDFYNNEFFRMARQDYIKGRTIKLSRYGRFEKFSINKDN